MTFAQLHTRPSEKETKYKLLEAGCDEQHANPDEQVIVPVFPKHFEPSLFVDSNALRQ